MLYLDSSALLKLIIDEKESRALRCSTMRARIGEVNVLAPSVR